MGHLCDPLAWNDETAGEIPTCMEVKLVDYPEAGYFATNKPNPQGEIWIRGDNVMEEYYENPEATEEVIAPGGWFKTGDIGQFDRNGMVKVIDRKKNLVKTLNGEYIALEKVRISFALVRYLLTRESSNPSTDPQQLWRIFASMPPLRRQTRSL